MKNIIYILFVHIFLFTSCADYKFETSNQVDSEFNKIVSIEELIYLKENSSQTEFAKQLHLQATIVGIFDDYLYLTDNSKFALRVHVASASGFKIGDLVQFPVGGLHIATNNLSYDLSGTPEVSQRGVGVINANSIDLSDLTSNLTFYSSKLVTVSDLTTITLIDSKHNGKYYSFSSVNAESIFFVPDSLDYQSPKELVSLTGFVRIQDNKAVLNVRSKDDIKEIYIEPLMIEKIMNNSTLVKTLIQNNESEVAPGVKFAQFSYTNSANLLTSGSLFEIDLNNPNVKIEAGSPNNAAPPFSSIQPLATMAQHKNTAYAGTGWKVLAAMTGDFYNASAPYTLNGPLVRNGNILKSDFTGVTDNFLAVLKDGEGFVVGGRSEFDQIKNKIEQAAGGRVILKDGQIIEVVAIREPRTAIGFTKKNKVYFFVGNGRMLSVSNGYSPLELSQLMKALDCDGALYGNGGGATVGVMEGTDGTTYEKFSESHATNANHNPSLASAWMIVTKR